jgi:hypothetical protein
MNRLPHLGALVGLVLSVLASSPAFATVAVDRTFEVMTRESALVVRAQVGPGQARWAPDGSLIWTYAEVRVLESLKGRGPATVLVRQPGGRVGEVEQRVSGVAPLTEGEEVVLFLEAARDEAGVFTVSGFAAGKVRLEASKVGARRATRDLAGLALYRLEAQSKGARVAPVGPQDLGDAEAFLKRIRRAARGAK